MSVPATISELQEHGLPSPEEIMGKMADMYSSLSSYQDTGTVERRNSGSAITTKSLFRTDFVRPGFFRFQFDRDFVLLRSPIVLLFDDDRIRLSRILGIREYATLGRAVRAAAASTSLTSTFIIPLLIPAIGGRTVFDMNAKEVVGVTSIGGEQAYEIRGINVNQPMTIWISTKTFLLLQVRRESMISGNRVTRLVRYQPNPAPSIDTSRLSIEPLVLSEQP